jgi:hypothetical protein
VEQPPQTIRAAKVALVQRTEADKKPPMTGLVFTNWRLLADLVRWEMSFRNEPAIRDGLDRAKTVRRPLSFLAGRDSRPNHLIPDARLGS